MAEYKLTYFDLRALGESIRWILKVAGAKFEDERIDHTKWLEFKNDPRFPLGQIPILTINATGQVLTQSLAIMRYLSNKYGMVTDDDLLNFRSDQIACITEDGRLVVRSMFLETNPDKKEEMRKDLVENFMPRLLKQISDLISLTEGDFVVGDKLTYGDFYLANWLDIWEQVVDAKILDNYPVLKKQKEAVLNVPAIKEWIDIRPHSII